tara:strand:- start:334 stop:705 length:372 start_codon:yes stop_codon:yes gene_type:complete
MKNFYLILLSIILFSCNDSVIIEPKSDTFLGKLVKKGICMNYVIQVNDSDFPQDLIEDKWTDESSNKKYNNVFALKSICDFPENIQENNSFIFMIDSEKENNCAVCYAYTPVPNKSINITVKD